MRIESVGEIIATRTLTLLQEKGPPTQVTVLLGKPQQLPDHPDYYCPYQVAGVGTERAKYMCGVDPFQALQLALAALGVDLESLNKELAGRLRWECGDNGDLGFPVGP